MNAKSQIGPALLAAAFLLFNPAGMCARLAIPSPPCHPCCPKTPAPIHEDCGKPDCAHMNALPLTAAVPMENDSRQILAIPANHNGEAEELRMTWVPTVREGVAIGDRLLIFHQLLI
jgi:hypothetical protein